MHNHWLVLLPPLLVLVLGFTTRRVMFSLICGIVSAAFIASDFSPIATLSLSLSRLWKNTELANLMSFEAFSTSENLFIYIFLFILGIIVTLLGHSGGSYAYGSFVQKRLHSARSAESSSLILSMCLFVDDYFNSLTVGSVMHPITDRFKIPRTKLAFLVDSMAAPLAMVIPISSWVAVIVGFLGETGINASIEKATVVAANPFYVYLNVLPYVFYSSIIFLSAWFIVLRRISFGSMHTHEKIAQETGNLFGGKMEKKQSITSAHERNKSSHSIIDFIFPIAVLFACIVGGLLYSGGFYLFGGPHSLVQALQNAQAALTLFLGGVIMLAICMTFFVLRSRLALSEIVPVMWQGISLMTPSIVILLLSWTFGNILKVELQTGQYLAHILIGSVPLFALPVMFFVASAATSFAIGSSWGTMAIMFPIAVPMVASFLNISGPVGLGDISLLLPVLGSILSGGVLGDHISPISDTTIMSSTSTGSHHIDHVQTQMTYALPIAFATAIAFVVAGFFSHQSGIARFAVPIGIGLVISFGSLQLFDAIRARREKSSS